MEYVSGETLFKKIQRRLPMSLDTKLKYIDELCAGLAHAHRAGIVHRDIKPINLIVSNNDVLKILDFGIARLADSNMTQAGAVMGTLNYMSPEQVGGMAVDHRSDIFAVGSVVRVAVVSAGFSRSHPQRRAGTHHGGHHDAAVAGRRGPGQSDRQDRPPRAGQGPSGSVSRPQRHARGSGKCARAAGYRRTRVQRGRPVGDRARPPGRASPGVRRSGPRRGGAAEDRRTRFGSAAPTKSPTTWRAHTRRSRPATSKNVRRV